MVMMRGTQLVGQVKILQMKLGMERLIEDAGPKRNNEFKTSANLGEEKVALSLKDSNAVTVNEPKNPTNPQQCSDADISDILIEYGNNSLKIPAINYASYLGKADAVVILLKYGANINQYSSKGTPLELALEHKHHSLASFLVSQHAIPTDKAAVFCCRNQYLDLLKVILDLKPSVAATWVVDICIMEGYLESLELLFENGAKIPNTCGESMSSCLASKDKKYVPIVKFLIKRGADCTYRHSKKNLLAGHTNTVFSSLLARAIDFDDEELVKLLIKNKAPLNAQIIGQSNSPVLDTDYYIDEFLSLDPLYKSLLLGKLNYMQLLLNAGANKSDYYNTYLGRQIRKLSQSSNLDADSHFSKVKIMVEKGFLNQNNFFHDMLLFAIHKKNDLRWVALLYDLGAQVKDYLNHAIQAKNKDIVKFLLEHGASL